MKKILFALLMMAAGCASVHAQKTEQMGDHLGLLLSKTDKLDSLYNYWNGFVAQHPLRLVGSKWSSVKVLTFSLMHL